ncbi:hypothetical protein H0H92_007710 [Tricholoma furcatifolium]|nr:hypothetical protein H0H92_007710 [Tricholoma furcatifolium]
MPHHPDKLIPKKHHHYWLRDGDIVIQVQTTLFRLPLSVLHDTKSPILSTIAPPPLNTFKARLPSGYNEAHPFVLQNTSAHDFVRLLRVLIPSYACVILVLTEN